MSGSERRTLFADVILPLAVPQYYTYRIPLEMNEDVLPGMRAIVQFGKNKLYTAIVRNVHQTAPRHYEAKYLDGILDERPIVTEQQMTFWEWMADYYCCTPGEVFLAAVPGSLRLGSETVIVPD
ncbi:MAG TPA: primosomal protein N', partial [Flavobacteriales bacterium]|nr:primosomal protein N' [Flavobacteriales bacterium]HRJ36091.1 primosomal protein N' [Flavobacteriales bacterium]